MDLFDSHLHLDDPKYAAGEVGDVIARARAAGVRAMVTAGVDLESSRAAGGLTEHYPEVFAAVGCHPHEAGKLAPRDMAAIEDLLVQPRVVAVGEIGLDYHYENSPRDIQRQVFEQHLRVAEGRAMPVVVHSRDADADTEEILCRWADTARRSYAERPLGILHCFSGDLARALRYIGLGFYISLAGPVTYPNARKAQEVAAGVPLDRLLVETDAPYLPPQSQRGQRNEPANVQHVVEQIARLRGIAAEAVAAQTARNAEHLFDLASQ